MVRLMNRVKEAAIRKEVAAAPPPPPPGPTQEELLAEIRDLLRVR